MSRLDHPKMIWYLKLVTNPIQCTFKMNWYWFSEIPFFLARSLPNQIWRKQANDDLANSRLWEFVCLFFRLSTESQSRPTTWRYWEQLFGCPGKIHDVRHSVLAIGGSLFNHFTFRRGITLNFALFAMLFRNLLLILEGEGGSFITSTTWARHHSICRWLDAEVQSSSKWLFTSKSITMFIDNFAIIVVLQWKSGPMLESQLSPSQTLQHAKKRKRERERSSRFFFIKSQHSHSFPASILCSGSMLANHSDVLLLDVYPLFIIYSWRGSVLVFLEYVCALAISSKYFKNDPIEVICW